MVCSGVCDDQRGVVSEPDEKGFNQKTIPEVCFTYCGTVCGLVVILHGALFTASGSGNQRLCQNFLHRTLSYVVFTDDDRSLHSHPGAEKNYGDSHAYKTLSSGGAGDDLCDTDSASIPEYWNFAAGRFQYEILYDAWVSILFCSGVLSCQ